MAPPKDDPQGRLLRLLAVKRYEIPPPGFFDRFPDRIAAALRQNPPPHVPRSGWARLAWILREEPLIAGSYAALGVGAMLFGVSVYQVALDQGTAPNLPANIAVALPGPGGFSLGAFSQAAAGQTFQVSPAFLDLGPSSEASGAVGGAAHAIIFRQNYGAPDHERLPPRPFLVEK